jgi:hypothetical protein
MPSESELWISHTNLNINCLSSHVQTALILLNAGIGKGGIIYRLNVSTLTGNAILFQYFHKVYRYQEKLKIKGRQKIQSN